MKITFKQNGRIELFGNWIGVWSYEDVWASYGKYDKSGNRLTKCFWHAYLINGEHIFLYTRNELKEAISNRWSKLLDIALNTTDEQKQDGINNVEFFASKEVRNIEELKGNKK